ncbi:hypothetical protein GCM10009037_02710 [Halarchaeum grantii]|uniref:DUF8113 domain-containing protein n=1 Tax=Halarchaeum grantii TaxID=1193105 RepID=A0A830F610_9EURY|nr:hypothetical protein [Halarchaeum grantii]GGL22755.1 hypothetical protein GCM10009037_02710 [Halarchaeum grantii]
MSESETTQFEEVREQATAALERDDLTSIYLGLLTDDGENEFFFGNDTDDPRELQQTASRQLGMLCRVLANQSDLTVEQVADLAAQRAKDLGVEH